MIADRRFLLIDGQKIALDTKELPMDVQLIRDLTPLATLKQLEKLYLPGRLISDLAPLAELKELKSLDLSMNRITDLTPLTGLLQLRDLKLNQNQIVNLIPLAALAQLKKLDLHENQITDVTPVAQLQHLAILELSGNPVSDISPLTNLTRMVYLYLSNTQVQEISHLAYMKQLRNEYDTGAERYIGLHQTISISKGETEDTAWAAAILIPQDSYAAYTAEIQKTWIIAALGLLVVLLALSFFLARRFVRPITDSLKRFQQEELPEQGLSSGISEVDELAEFLNARARNQRLEQGELPPNIAELFDQFVARKDLLTEAERNILRYYIDGHEIADIPDLAFISMSTVRKHNRSIYEKLGVASRDELMLYIDLLRRCGRLQELF